MKKLKLLLGEKEYRISEKAGLSVIIGFAVSFNYLFFGMLHIFISNYPYFMIPFARVLLSASVVSIAVWVILSGVLLILPGRFFGIAASLTAGVIIAGYVQSNFLNNPAILGALTGDAINWHEYTRYTLFNLVIWIIILILPAAVKYFVSAKTWKWVVIGICTLLTGMQATALVVNYISNSEQMQHEPEYYLSREGSYEVSSNSNILVFVVDRLDYEYIDAVRESDPSFFDKLDGFTDFTNAASMYEATFPSGVLMTTGVPYDYKQTRTEYFEYAWNNSEFISVLKDAGYTMKYHIGESGYMYSDYEQLVYAADNIKDGSPVPVFWSIVENLVKLSAYRNAPMTLKPAFWMPGIQIKTTGEITEREYITGNDPLFMELLTESGLTALRRGNNYFYLHLNGAHPPYIMDESGLAVAESNLVAQTKGCFSILYNYMDEMKRLGVYEDSTIIILGDHGWGDFHIGFFAKPKGSAGTPLIQNSAPVSISDHFLATILKSEGLEYDAFGTSVFDIEENTTGERYVVRYAQTGDTVEFFKVTGHIRDENSRELTDSFEFFVDFGLGLPID